MVDTGYDGRLLRDRHLQSVRLRRSIDTAGNRQIVSISRLRAKSEARALPHAGPFCPVSRDRVVDVAGISRYDPLFKALGADMSDEASSRAAPPTLSAFLSPHGRMGRLGYW